MSEKKFEKWQVPSMLGPCVCSQLRRTARKVSSIYDKALGVTGLTVTQHSLLVNIARAEEIGRTALAARLGIDRTTLTRNLKPLERAGFVVPADSSDRRERLLCLSPEGRRKLRHSYAYWEKAQQEFTSAVGPAALEDLRAALQAAEEAAAKALGREHRR